ncbi:MAG: hypothetical protein JEZ11_20140 [Desulfobacterales bacterium]|nr:hypothetical protein [Desulfobacterales bacterium]
MPESPNPEHPPWLNRPGSDTGRDIDYGDYEENDYEEDDYEEKKDPGGEKDQ